MVLLKFSEYFFNLFNSKKAKIEKLKASIELNNANKNYLEAQKRNEKYLSKYSGRKRYQKV